MLLIWFLKEKEDMEKKLSEGLLGKTLGKEAFAICGATCHLEQQLQEGEQRLYSTTGLCPRIQQGRRWAHLQLQTKRKEYRTTRQYGSSLTICDGFGTVEQESSFYFLDVSILTGKTEQQGIGERANFTLHYYYLLCWRLTRRRDPTLQNC